MNYQDFIFIGNSLIVFFAFKKLKESTRYILTLSYALSIIFHFSGSYILIYHDNWWIRYVSQESLSLSFLMVQIYTLAFSLLIILKNDKSYLKKININAVLGLEKYIFCFIILFCILGVVLILKKTVLYNFIVNPSLDKVLLANYRNEITFNENKIFLYFNNIFLDYFSVLIFSYYSIIRYSIGRHKFKIMFYLSLFVVIFASLITLSKAPILKILFLSLFLKIVYDKENCILLNVKQSLLSYKKYIVFGVAILIIMFGVTKGFNDVELMASIIDRIFISQHVGLPNAIEFFPEHIEYLKFTSISPSVSRFFGIEYNKFSRILMEKINTLNVEENVSGFLSTIYFAESYAIGGIIFVLISIFFIFFLLARIDNIYYLSDSPLIHSIYSLLFIKIPFLMNDSLKGIFFNVPLIVVLFSVFIIHIVNKSNSRYKYLYQLHRC